MGTTMKGKYEGGVRGEGVVTREKGRKLKREGMRCINEVGEKKMQSVK